LRRCKFVQLGGRSITTLERNETRNHGEKVMLETTFSRRVSPFRTVATERSSISATSSGVTNCGPKPKKGVEALGAGEVVGVLVRDVLGGHVEYRREPRDHRRRLRLGDVPRFAPDNEAKLGLTRNPSGLFGKDYLFARSDDGRVRAHKARRFFGGGRLAQVARVLDVVQAAMPQILRGRR